MKSTAQQIGDRFGKDLERFSGLEIGTTTSPLDSILTLELIAWAALSTIPNHE